MKRFLSSPWALLGVIALLRLPGFAFGILDIDESDYLVYGASLLKGFVPYRDFVEIKPPFGYFTYALAGGLHLWPIRVLSVFWVFATALLLRAAARRWTGSERAGWAAAWMSILASFVEVPSFGGEVMMNLPIAGAIYFLVRGRAPRHLLACGICAGIATLYRPQAAIAPVAFGLALLFRPAGGYARALERVAAMAVGVLAPWVVAGAFYAVLGQLPTFVEWVFWRNLGYASSGGTGFGLAHGIAAAMFCVSAACVPWVLAARESVRLRDDEIWRALSFMLWLTWIPALAGGRLYEHYFLQFVPPLAMLAAPGAAALAESWGTRPIRTRSLALIGVGGPLVLWLAFAWGKGLLGAYPAQEPRTREVARWLRASSAPNDTLFVWGHFSPIYTLSGLLPGTRYVNTSPHMGNRDPAHLPAGFDAAAHRSERDVEATLHDLETRKPVWFVDTSPARIHGWDRVPLSAFPRLARYREEHYVEVARPGGAPIYRRAEVPRIEARQGR